MPNMNRIWAPGRSSTLWKHPQAMNDVEHKCQKPRSVGLSRLKSEPIADSGLGLDKAWGSAVEFVPWFSASRPIRSAGPACA